MYQLFFFHHVRDHRPLLTILPVERFHCESLPSLHQYRINRFDDRESPRKIQTRINLIKHGRRWKKRARDLTINRANDRCSLPRRFVKSIVRFR